MGQQKSAISYVDHQLGSVPSQVGKNYVKLRLFAEKAWLGYALLRQMASGRWMFMFMSFHVHRSSLVWQFCVRSQISPDIWSRPIFASPELRHRDAR